MKVTIDGYFSNLTRHFVCPPGGANLAQGTFEMENCSIGWVQTSAEGNQSSVRRWGPNYCNGSNPNLDPYRVASCIKTIKIWAFNGNPQRYTEPSLPSAEQCTVPFLENWPTLQCLVDKRSGWFWVNVKIKDSQPIVTHIPIYMVF